MIPLHHPSSPLLFTVLNRDFKSVCSRGSYYKLGRGYKYWDRLKSHPNTNGIEIISLLRTFQLWNHATSTWTVTLLHHWFVVFIKRNRTRWLFHRLQRPHSRISQCWYLYDPVPLLPHRLWRTDDPRPQVPNPSSQGRRNI